MAKPKTPKVEITEEHIDKAADSGTIKGLVSVATAFTRAGAHGPFETQLPIFTSVHIKDKGYRKINVPIGTKVQAKDIIIGARAGLIFRFDVVAGLRNSHGEAEWLDLSWDDVVNTLLDFAERVTSGGAGDVDIKAIDTGVKNAIAANKAMHPILSQGFAVAQTRGRETAQDESLTSIPGFGSF